MTKATSKYCLYAGLLLLAVAIILRWQVAGFPLVAFWGMAGMGILLKILFLVNVFRAKDFKPALWLYLVLAGVGLILLSLLFKYVWVMPLLRNVLFYGAILLKVSGLVLLLAGKKAFVLLLLLGISSGSYAQGYDLSSLQGLRNAQGELSLECSGYDIFITKVKGNLNNAKTLESIRKDYSLRNVQAQYTDNLSLPHTIIEAVREHPRRGEALSMSQLAVLLQQQEKEVTVLYFETMNQRDIVLEKEIVGAYLRDGLAAYLSDEWRTTRISLAGKEIDLVHTFDWAAPHFVTGGNSGMKWSEFPSMMAAELDINKRIDRDMSRDMDVLYEGDIQVTFDGLPTLAYRVVYRDYYSDSYANVLTAYYIAEELRGKYISCVLTHYGQDVNDYRLSYLQQQVMKLSEMPPSIEVEEEYVYESAYETDKSLMNMVELQVGTWVPVGKLSRVFPVAPSIGAYVGYPFSNRFKVDFGVQLAFPVNRSYFPYYDHSVVKDAKPNVIVGLSLRGHYQQQIASKSFFTLYGGLGMNGITTNLEYEYYTDESDRYYSCETLDILGGVSLRHRAVGCFLEYHYTPYSISGKVKRDFGNSAFNLGLMFSF